MNISQENVRQHSRLENIRDTALGVGAVALTCLMDGQMPGTSHALVTGLELAAYAGAAVGVTAEVLHWASEQLSI